MSGIFGTAKREKAGKVAHGMATLPFGEQLQFKIHGTQESRGLLYDKHPPSGRIHATNSTYPIKSFVQFLPVTKLKTTNPLQSLVPEFGYRTFGIILELTAQTGNVVT